MVVVEEQTDRENKDGGWGINKNEWKGSIYPGDIITTVEMKELENLTSLRNWRND